MKFCVAFSNMLQLESVSISLGLLKSDIEIIKATFECYGPGSLAYIST